MNDKTKGVMRGFLNLSLTERQELITEMNKYIQSDPKQQNLVAESYKQLSAISKGTSVNFGPAPLGGCACCGK